MQSVCPVLNSEAASELRVVRVGQIARREDAGHAGAQQLVHDHAIVQRESRALGEIHARLDPPDAYDDEIALQRTSVAEHDTLHTPGAIEALDRCLADELHVMIGVNIAVDLPQLGTKHAFERELGALDQRDLAALLARRGRHLGADPSGAHYCQPAPTLDALAQTIGVGDRSQVVDVLELGARDAQPSRRRTGRQQQLVEANALAFAQLYLLRRRVDGGRLAPAAQLDARAFVVARVVVNPELLATILAAQVALRKRRAFVWRLGLGADQHDATVKPSSRSVSAARAPARPAPMITNVC
jgi:hypothetical protein